MSQPNRRVLVVMGLAASLLLAVPAPSRAAGVSGLVPATDLVAQAWSWLEGLLGAHQKTAVLPPPPPPPPPPSSPDPAGQGSMIDPDGVKG